MKWIQMYVLYAKFTCTLTSQYLQPAEDVMDTTATTTTTSNATVPLAVPTGPALPNNLQSLLDNIVGAFNTSNAARPGAANPTPQPTPATATAPTPTPAPAPTPNRSELVRPPPNIYMPKY